MTFGFDVSPHAPVCCAAKKRDQQQICAGVLLDVYGTVPDRNSVCRDSHERVLIQTKYTLLEILDRLATGSGAYDIQLSQMTLVDELHNINHHIREVRAFLGQGIYLGGVVLYSTAQSYAVISFGGTTVLHLGIDTLKPIFPPPPDQLIRNALGANSVWKPEVFVGDWNDETRGILAVNRDPCCEGCLPILEKHLCLARATQQTITSAALVRRELEQRYNRPAGALLFQR